MNSNSLSLLSGLASSALKLIVFNTECVRQPREVKESTDMWKAILELRNATIPDMHRSPAQRFFSKHTHSMLPCKTTDYTPQVQAEIQSTLIRKRQTAKTHYDRHTKPLPDLNIGQPVRVKCHPQIPNSNWESGTVIGKEATCSYRIQENGRFYRRNRIHIRQPATLPTSVPAVPQQASMPQPAETKKHSGETRVTTTPDT